MSGNFPKLASWEGKNKGRVRLYKKYDVRQLLKEDGASYDRTTGWEPRMLTFSGPEAALERLLSNHGLLQPENITTIQTYEKLSEGHNGEPILKKLIKTRREYLPGMQIWPHNFHSFARCYKLGGCGYPSRSAQARWAKPPFRRFMDQMVKAVPERFAIMDLDLCGIFSERNASSVISLFRHRVVEPNGVMFLTHQKGRDVHGGKLFKVLHDYLSKCPYIDYESIAHINEPGYETYVARYILIPLYYMCKIYELGYVVEMTRLIEYRDSDDGPAVNMLQYFFKWYDTDYMGEPEEYARRSMSEVMADDYKYCQWID